MKFYGDTATLGSGASGTIRLKAPEKLKATVMMVNSTGRCKITDISVVGKERLLDGSAELALFKQHGNTFDLVPPIERIAGEEILISLLDISAASNTVYICLGYTPA